MNCIFVWEKNWNLAWKETPRAWPWFLQSYCHTHTLSSFLFFFFWTASVLLRLTKSFRLINSLQPSMSSGYPSPSRLGLRWEWSEPWTRISARMRRWTTGLLGAMGLGCLRSPPIGAHRRVSFCWGRSGTLYGEVLWDHMSSFNTFTLIYSPKKSKLCLQDYESSLIEILTWLLCCRFYSSKNHKQQALLCYLFALGFACQAAITLWLVENYMSLRLPQRQPRRHKPGKNSGKYILHIFH